MTDSASHPRMKEWLRIMVPGWGGLMYRSFFGSTTGTRQRLIAFGGPVLLFVFLVIQVQSAVAFANMMNVFGNLVQSANTTAEHYLPVALKLLLIYFWFFLCETAINYITRRYQWHWRQAVTLAYIRRWNEQAATMEGSSQILADAVNNFTQLALTLFTPVVRSALVLVFFFPMLWEVSKSFDVAIFGWHVPGVLLWVSIIFSGLGTFISWKVGATLPTQEWQIQKYEARFRSRVEAAQFVPHTPQKLGQDMKGAEELFDVKINFSYRALHRYLLKFDIWFHFYKQSWGFLPLTLLGLFVISGTTSYGAMMQAMSALNETSGSLSIFSSLMTTFTKFKSYVQRLEDLEAVLEPPATMAPQALPQAEGATL